MGRSENPEYVAKSLSAGQLVLLFLAGAAVCGVFFSAGFWVGHNEKESPLTPVTERVTQSTDIPPVVTQDSSSAADDSVGAGSKGERPAATDAQSAPLRPQPLSSSTDRASELLLKPGTNSRKSPAVAPPQEAAASNASALAGIPTAASLREPASGGGSTFLIQVAATSTQPDAVKMVKALKSLDYPVIFVTPEQAHAGDNLFRVQVGPFATRESAEKVKAKLLQDGFKQPFIKH